ncbi:MAG TPA: DUF5994 family protein [Jatrophihabitans sp.]
MTTRHDTRLVIAERLVRRDHLHGAWWPHTTDIEHELAPMLSRALTRLHAVLGVTLNRDEWPGAPLILQPLPTRSPTVSWYGLTEPHFAVLHCGGHNRIALLVLPPETPEEVAVTAMLMTAAPGNHFTTTETLARAREHAQPTSPKWIDAWSLVESAGHPD